MASRPAPPPRTPDRSRWDFPARLVFLAPVWIACFYAARAQLPLPMTILGSYAATAVVAWITVVVAHTGRGIEIRPGDLGEGRFLIGAPFLALFALFLGGPLVLLYEKLLA